MIKHHDEDHHGHHKRERLDPHVWATPNNMIIMATNIKDTLVKIDPANKILYNTNYIKLVDSLKQTDLQIKTILKNTQKEVNL